MKNIRTFKEQGSAHVIIISLLTVALVGALGFVFWQNFINKPESATDTKAVASTTPEPSAKPTLKTYCAKIEKLCFDYPSNWTVEDAKDSNQYETQDEMAVIKDNEGVARLDFKTGLSGLGGACQPNKPGWYSKIIKTHTTAVKGNYLTPDAPGDIATNTVYAYAAVSRNGSDKDWTAQMALNNTSLVQKIGQADSCGIGPNIIKGKTTIAPDSDLKSSIIFQLHAEGDATTYTSEADATAALTSANADKAFDILKSAHYK